MKNHEFQNIVNSKPLRIWNSTFEEYRAAGWTYMDRDMFNQKQTAYCKSRGLPVPEQKDIK